jgi:hypothetical protein
VDKNGKELDPSEGFDHDTLWPRKVEPKPFTSPHYV